MNDETASYTMLFFALILVRARKADLHQSLAVVPLTGGARRLAAFLTADATDPVS